MEKFGKSHSLIPSYPPNITKYPLFYDCKEYIVVLHPGEALYIPPRWFHWVFSYPESEEERKNIAISYHISSIDESKQENTNRKPMKYKLDKNNYVYFNYTFNNLKKTYSDKKFTVLKSKENIIIPIEKPTLKNNIYQELLTLDDIENQHNDYNIYIGQNNTFKTYVLPDCIKKDFIGSKFRCFHWIASFKHDTEYIDSGLHYDKTHGLLISIKGIKIVRLYHPNDYENLYVQTMKYREPKTT